MDDTFLLYEIDSGTVFYLPFAQFGSESRQLDGIGLEYSRNDFPGIGVSWKCGVSMTMYAAH